MYNVHLTHSLLCFEFFEFTLNLNHMRACSLQSAHARTFSRVQRAPMRQACLHPRLPTQQTKAAATANGQKKQSMTHNRRGKR